jgi:hypothetical protein
MGSSVVKTASRSILHGKLRSENDVKVTSTKAGEHCLNGETNLLTGKDLVIGSVS